MADNRIFQTQDGSHSIVSGRFGASYHSRYGAVQESRHVFIQAGLYPLMLVKDELDILEIGFGSGLNALLSMWESIRRQFPVRYTAMEAFPVSQAEVQQLNFHEWLADFTTAKSAFLAMHEAPWDTWSDLYPTFRFKKVLEKFEELDAPQCFDLIYFDPFSPETQPELWTGEVLARMYAALRPGGVLVTYCAKGVVKRRLKALGFTVEALKGPPGKREMTRASKPAAVE